MIRVKRTLLALALTCVLTTVALAQAAAPVEISAHVDRASVGLGESVLMTVDVSYPPSGAIQLPSADKLDFAPFEVRDAAMAPQPASGGRKHVQYRIRLAAYETGKLTIPPLKVQYKAADGTSEEKQSSPIPLEVGTSAAPPSDKPAEIRDLKPLDDVPTPPWMIATAVGAGVLGIALVALLARFAMRRLRRRPAPPMLPHEKALAALQALLEERLPEQGQTRLHYDRLATILREYLAGRFDLPSLEHTTVELVALMRARQMDEWLCAEVRSVLDEADLVKFARQGVDKEKTVARVATVRSLVERTVPPPPPDAKSASQPAPPPAPRVANKEG